MKARRPIRRRPLECGDSSPLWLVAKPLSFGRWHVPKEKAAPPQRKAVMNHRTPKEASHRQSHQPSHAEAAAWEQTLNARRSTKSNWRQRNTPVGSRAEPLNVHSSGCNPEKRSASDRPTAQRLNGSASGNRGAARRTSRHECHSTALRLCGGGITCLRVAPGAMHMAALRATRTRAEAAA